MTHSQKRLVIVGIMLSVFMASMESTVIATAMPTVASELGGIERYSWVFAAYLLTSTTTVPIFGKLSDLYGRKKVFVVAMAIFLVGSLLCGMAQSMDQLVWYRALQGIGAGGVLPLAFIMIGEMFTLEQRARFQGFFSGVWGVSAVVGPLIGGFIVDSLSWSWVFWINLLPGVVATTLVGFAWRDAPRPMGHGAVRVDYFGAVLLSACIVALMLGLQGAGSAQNLLLVALSLVLLAALLWWERRAADPILPMALFRGRLFSTAVGHGFLSGWAMFGSLSFVPLFVQAVIRTTATGAGITLTPMLLSWVVASIVGSRLLLRFEYKRVAVTGMVLLSLGTLLMSFVSESTNRAQVMFYLALMGTGMGLSIPAFLIAVQSTVERRSLGTATSMLQFSRSIGGTLGVAVMGALLTNRLVTGMATVGAVVDAGALNALVAGTDAAPTAVVVGDALRVALANGIGSVFLVSFVAAALGLVVTALAPGGRIATLAAGNGQDAENETGAATAAPAILE